MEDRPPPSRPPPHPPLPAPGPVTIIVARAQGIETAAVGDLIHVLLLITVRGHFAVPNVDEECGEGPGNILIPVWQGSTIAERICSSKKFVKEGVWDVAEEMTNRCVG